MNKPNKPKTGEMGIHDQSLMVAQMLSSPPEALGPREWFVNLDELSRATGQPVNGTVREVSVKGTKKLVLQDDGPGMPPHSSKEFSLERFVSNIADSGEYKISEVDGNQGRGFRFAWSAYNPMGIIVLSKVKGGKTYRARWWLNAKTQRWNYEAPMVDVKPLVDLGDHGTAFIMMGDSAKHDTSVSPFEGVENYRHGGNPFSSLLTRRVHNPEATCRVEAEGLLVGGTTGKNNASKVTRFFGRDASSVMEVYKVHIKAQDITMEWVKHVGDRFENRGMAIFGGTDLKTSASIVFDNEIMDWTEGDEWTTIADGIGDIGYVGDAVSVRIVLGKSWKNRAKQSFDRTKLEWQQGMRDRKRECDRRKGYGANVLAVRSFAKELNATVLYPQWLKDLVAKRKRERDQSVEDKQRQRWEELMKKYKLHLNPNGPNPSPGISGDPFIVPLPGIVDGPDVPPDFFKGGAKLEVEIKPLAGDHEKKYPVLHSYDTATKVWTMALSLNSPYVRDAMNEGAKVLTGGKDDDYTQLTVDQITKVRTSVENAAALTLARHFLFVQVHKSKGLYTEEDVDIALKDQPASTLALQHFFDWMKLIPAVIKSDYLTKTDNNVVAMS